MRKVLVQKAIGLLLLSVTVLGCQYRQSEESSPAGEDLSDLFIHPLCLDGIGERDGAECTPPDVEVNRTVLDDGRVSFWSDRPKEDDSYAGYIGYVVADRWGYGEPRVEQAFLQVTNNGGGTGQFSHLALVERKGGRYTELMRIRAGDRCNDGDIRLLDFNDREIVYSTAATPFRLLNPEDPALSSPQTLFGWRSYEDIDNCAACCAGRIVHRLDLADYSERVTGLEIDKDAFNTGGKVLPVQACVQRWMQDGSLDTKERMSIEAWRNDMPRLERMCVPPPEVN